MKGARLCAILILAVVWQPLARAQFQAPTDEELKMTSDPKAPGAAAVYLYREETADDEGHSHTYRERIKEKLGLQNAFELIHQAVRWIEQKSDGRYNSPQKNRSQTE